MSLLKPTDKVLRKLENHYEWKQDQVLALNKLQVYHTITFPDAESYLASRPINDDEREYSDQ